MKVLYAWLITGLLFFSSDSYSQTLTYQYDTSIAVYNSSGVRQTLAWCGGFNNPQFSMADLNNDGRQDLVVFEPGRGVRTFINTGTAGNPNYIYQPGYALNFPPVSDYLILADYNCDGIADLFQQGSTGFAVYKGYYNGNNQLCFAFYKDLFYNNDAYANGNANAFNNPGDIPAIVDVDNDGDLDFISYDVIGGNLNFYKNMRVEDNLPCDSIVIDLKDRCWGKVYQAFYRTHQLHYDCSEAGLERQPVNKATHQGNTPCLFDYDGDGDYDYLDGSISFNEMTFLLNGKTQYGGNDSMIYQDTAWQANGKQIEIPLWPAAFNIDVDQDGKKDLLIAPNAQNTSENYKCIWYYHNESTAGNPSWVFKSDTFLIDKTIDAGSAATPMLYDYNKDGKPDLFIGSDGYYKSDGTFKSRVLYYQNTSTSGSPSFTLQSSDFLGLSTYNYQGATLAVGDLDNDGKEDMVIGHNDGSVSYFKNMAASATVQPDWQLSQQSLTDAGNNAISAGGGYAAPYIYDINKDGKPDLVLGEMYGYLQYYQNTNSTTDQVSLQLINNELGNARVDGRQNLGNYSTPFIGKIDSTGNDYLLMGSNSGNIYRFDGFQSGDITASYTMLDSQYADIDTAYLLYNHAGASFALYGNFRSAVTVGDIDGDGIYEMIVGNIQGGVKLFKQKPVPAFIKSITRDDNVSVNLYPNPADNLLNIAWDKASLSQPVQIAITDLSGRHLQMQTISSQQEHTQISVSDKSPGVYICDIQIGHTHYYKRFTVLR